MSSGQKASRATVNYNAGTIPQVLYGSTGIGLITIDTNTGAGSLVGPFGIQTGVWGLEFDSGNNILYGATNYAANPYSDGQLLTISRTTGTATPVGGLIGSRVEGLAYDSVNNQLYGCTYPANNLVAISTSTGQGTVIGSTGFQNLEGLAFNPLDGKLYSVDVGSGALIRIEPSIGIGTAVAQIPSSWVQIRGLSFDSSGRLYGAYQPFSGASTQLVIIDISTGQITNIGPTGYSSLEGLAFVYQSIAHANKYAILVAPVRKTDGSEDEFKHNIYAMRKILLSSGWTDNNIIFLTRNDVAKQETNEPWIDGDATYQNVLNALNAIAFGGTYSFIQTGGSLGPPQTFSPSGPNDIVFIELRDHGGQYPDRSRPAGMMPDPNPGDETIDYMDGLFGTYDWNDWNPVSLTYDWNQANYWYDDEFALKLNNIVCSKLVLMVDACASGEFIRECSGTGRLIITSCAEGQTSARTAYVFYLRIVNLAADGYGPNGIKDGKISVQEAHYYAVSQIQLSQIQQTPQISDGIGGQFYLDPPNDSNPVEHSDVGAKQGVQNQQQTLLNSNHVLINEFFYNYANLQEPLQWVELYNPTGTSVDLSGWVLAFDSIDGINLFPSGIIIGPGQYIIVTHDSEAFSEKYTVPSGVMVIDDDEMGNNLGALLKDTLRLYDATHINVVDHLDYGGGSGRAPAVAPPNSIARYKGGFDTNNSENDWYVETKPTPGSENPQEYTHALGHNVAVLNVTVSKTIIGKGFTSNVTLLAANKGDYPETFNVTAYYHGDGTISEPIDVLSLNASESTNKTFTWNTTGFAYGNYTISVYASPVLGETDTSDNNYTMSAVTITIPGDINGDFKVDMKDIGEAARAFGTAPGATKWDANADINNDGKVDMKDIGTAAKNFGKTT